jgi:putative ABC transport system ATP-binding protein
VSDPGAPGNGGGFDAGTIPGAATGPHGGVRLYAEQVGLDLGGRPVLDRVDLLLESGEPIALTGPSGSGKTVLCLVLAGALRPSRGGVRVEVSDGSAGARPYTGGLILQTHGLVPELTAEENVALPLQALRLSREDVAGRTAQALADVGLDRNAGRPVDELSGGERQRVGIARALARDPLVLVADEPTSELDPTNRIRVLGLLTAHAARGNVVVVASDDPEVVDECASVVTLDRGMVVGRRAAARRAAQATR